MSDVCCANLRSGRSPQPQQLVRIEYKGVVFDEPLRFDIMVDSCLLLELKAVEALHPYSKEQLFSYMKLLDVPVGLRRTTKHQFSSSFLSNSPFVFFVIFC